MPQQPNPEVAVLRQEPALLPVHGSASFSWSSELRHLTSGKIANSLAWPYYRYQQRYFSASPLFKQCGRLPGFNRLWSTIQKAGFAYNTLFLGQNPWKRSSTDLADLTTLALFWGDEFIDGIADLAGKSFVRSWLLEDPSLFYLQVRTGTQHPELFYRFDLTEMLDKRLLDSINSVYGISYRKFYELLRGFLSLINQSLVKLSPERADYSAGKIAEACNTCLESFLIDIREDTAAKPRDVQTVLGYHEQKSGAMQKKLLSLRCALAGQEEAMNSSQAAGWLDLMRVIQIYDDIHDPLLDWETQDNLFISTAYHLFPAEWKWFAQNQASLRRLPGYYVLYSANMPGTMEYCHRLAVHRIRPMNWEQQKIMHYLILRNPYNIFGVDERASRGNFLSGFYRSVRSRMPHMSNQEVKSFVLDTAMHLPAIRNRLLTKLDVATAYQLRFNLLAVDEEKKAAVADRLFS